LAESKEPSLRQALASGADAERLAAQRRRPPRPRFNLEHVCILNAPCKRAFRNRTNLPFRLGWQERARWAGVSISLLTRRVVARIET